MFTPNANPTVRIRAVKFVLLLVVSLPVCIAALSCVTEDDLTADQRVYQLSQQLMCPVCDGQTLDQSQAQLSEDMKAVIRNKIEEGATNAEIRDYFVERYGEIVLAFTGCRWFQSDCVGDASSHFPRWCLTGR